MKKIALIPARSGSLRVPGKNIKPLAGHPLIAYSIAAAINCNLLDRVIVSTDSEKIKSIALYYGAEVPFLRPSEFATSTSPDIDWIKHALSEIEVTKNDCVIKLNPTSPFRLPETIIRGWERFSSLKEIDSLRAVKLCSEHPGKMWVIDGQFMRPLLDQKDIDVAWHARQYQDLPKIYVQDSSLEIFWVRVVLETNTREGKIIAPFITEGLEGFSIDYEHDWLLAELYLENNKALLPSIKQNPYVEEKIDK